MKGYQSFDIEMKSTAATTSGEVFQLTKLQ